MDRREFLMKGLLAAAGVVAGGAALSGLMGLGGCASSKKRIGLQLYSLREAMDTEPEETLKAVAATGYKELETASYKDGLIYGMEPARFRALCEGLGMSVSSAHVGHPYDSAQDAQIMEWWNRALDAHAAAGCRYVVMPSFPIGQSLADVKGYCDYFNRVGELARAKGMRFGFHNHAGELGAVEGEVILDYMIANTDPEKVFFEMDTYWVVHAGGDPVAYLNKYAGRFPVLHIRDESIVGNSGTIDFGPIFEAAYAQGMQDFYVEVEKYTLPPLNCVEKSYDYLYGADFVK